MSKEALAVGGLERLCGTRLEWFQARALACVFAGGCQTLGARCYVKRSGFQKRVDTVASPPSDIGGVERTSTSPSKS